MFVYDKIRLLSSVDYMELIVALPREDLKKECLKLDIIPSSSKARINGYISAIEVTGPSKDFFKLMDIYSAKLEKYRITYLEFAKDVMFSTQEEATASVDKIIHTHVKKYSGGNIITSKPGSSPDPSLFGGRTGYLGGKRFKYTVYPRLSKYNNKPCAHLEMRIQGSMEIYKKTGIKTISDLASPTVHHRLLKLLRTDLITVEINYLKLGLWLQGVKKRKIEGKERDLIIQRAVRFCEDNGISTPALLKDFFMKEKRRIKKKPGIKSERDIKFLQIRSYKVFLDPI
jgi:hypothetical protein